MSSMNLRTNRTGQAENYVQLSWTNPAPSSSPQFGGVKVQYVNVTAGDGKVYDLGTVFKPANTFQIVVPAPNTIQNWDVYLVSFDVNGNVDSIAAGVTPTLAFSVGTTGGTFDLSNTIPSTLGGGIGLVSGAIQLSGVANVGQAQAFTALYIKPTSSVVGFIGYDPGSGYDGLWAQQAKVGGTGPANAPLYTDATGNVFLDATLGGGNLTITGALFTLNSSGVTTTIENLSLGSVGNGISVKNNTNSDTSSMGDGGIAVHYGAAASGDCLATVGAYVSGSYILLTDSAGNSFSLDSGFGGLVAHGSKVVGLRQTGWTTPTGTPLRSGYATGSATLTQVAETLMALITDLTTHGLIGT